MEGDEPKPVLGIASPPFGASYVEEALHRDDDFDLVHASEFRAARSVQEANPDRLLSNLLHINHQGHSVWIDLSRIRDGRSKLHVTSGLLEAIGGADWHRYASGLGSHLHTNPRRFDSEQTAALPADLDGEEAGRELLGARRQRLLDAG